MRIPIQAGRGGCRHEVLRLRRAPSPASRVAPRRITVVTGLLAFALLVSGTALATTYYVSSSNGNDGNPGTQAQPFQTLAKVNGLPLAAGDNVYLKRGDTWNEQLIPPASGTPGSPITFDAYGLGAAPVLTPIISLAGATWTHNSGNIYTTTLSTAIASPQINNLELGSVWGRKRSPNPSCATAGVIVGYGDFCVVYPTLYVYSPSGALPSAYYGSIVAVAGQATGLAVISIVNRSWLAFQHIQIRNFDYMGVSVTGTSDNLVFANMESDGMVPNGATPHGFYVNAPSATSIQFFNDDAHLNYDGFHIDGATAVTLTNCRGYANRDSGLKDNSGHTTYNDSHFYGNNVAQLIPGDVVGAIAGTGNLSSSVAPVVASFKTNPARFTFTVDDVGSSPGTETYIDSIVSLFTGRGIHFNAAVVPSYPVVWSDVNSWYAGGNEIDSHSWSHQYYTSNTNPCGVPPCSPPYPNAPALDIRYTGSGTAATLTISGSTLSLNVPGVPSDSYSVNLATAPYNQMGYIGTGGWGLSSYLAGLPNYSVTIDTSGPLVRMNTHTANLLHVSGQDIKTATYVLPYDQTLLLPDEMTSSKSAIQANVPGGAAFYVYPDGIEDPWSESDSAAAGYTAARGSLAMKGQDNTSVSANSLYANGVNVQNITSLAAIQVHGMSQAQVNQLVASLVFRASAWGVPYGLFTHYNSRSDNTPDISNVELGYLLDAVTANGGVWMTNMQLASAITSGNALSGTTRYVGNPTGAAVNLAAAGANSPTVGRGAGTSYPTDLNGTNRSGLGAWDVGASAYLSQRYGTGGGMGSTYVGWASAACGQPWYNCSAANVSAAVAPASTPPFSGLIGMGDYVAAPEPGNPGNIDNAPLYRVTDASFNFQNPSKTMVTNISGNGFDLAWNSNDTWMFTADTGSNVYFWQVNPARPVSATFSFKISGKQPNFSTINPNRYYYGSGTQILYADPGDTTHSATLLFDFSTCSGWSSTLGINPTDPPLPNYGDGLFSTGYSSVTAQNTGRLIAAYIAGSGCYWVNTQTMQMFGPSGLIGTYSPSHGTFKIHQIATCRGNCVLAQAGGPADAFVITSLSTNGTITTATYAPLSDGTQLIAGESVTVTGTGNFNGTFTLLSANASTITWSQTCSGCASESSGTATVQSDRNGDPFLWIPGAPDLSSDCGSGGNCSGHFVGGHTHFYNDTNNTIFAQKETANPGTVDFTFPVNDPCGNHQIPWDTHPTILPGGAGEGYLLFASTSGSAAPDYTKPCTQEIMGVLPSGSVTSVKRFSHLWSTPTWSFGTNESIAMFSQTGNFASFSSTMLGTLGDTSGNPSCTVGTVGNGPQGGTGGNCRADVFIVDLRGQYPVANVPGVTFATGLLGGIEATINNSNGGSTVSCVTVDGSAPETNGDGDSCANGFVSMPAAQGGGYFSLTQPATVKIVAGIAGGADSAANTYTATVSQQTITATHFGFQCGAQADCAGSGGSITWPSYAALPKLMRLHDSRTAWPWVQYMGTATASGSTLTWVSGTQFISGTSWVGQTVSYNGSSYTITAVSSATQMTVSPSIGTQASALPFTVTNWTYVDDYVDAIAAHPGMVGMETFTLFPCGAAPTTTHCGSNSNFPNGTSTPPADFSVATGSPSYNAFVSALVNHQTAGGHFVRDYVKVWELQNEWDLSAHLNDCGNMTACGTLLYQMLVPIAATIRANVPNAVILAPSATPASSTYKADYAGWLNLENTQGRISDFPNWHLYLAAGGGTTNTPEVQWVTYVSGAGTLLPIQQAAAGWNLTGWTDTETGFLGNTFVCPAQYTEADCAGQIARWQILHDSNGSVSLDWYKFNSTIANGPTTPLSYATVYQNLQALLIGGYFTAAAASDGNSPATWSASFTEASGNPGVWVWTDNEAGKSYTVPGGFSDYRDLNGGLTPVTAGQAITITTAPILLE